MNHHLYLKKIGAENIYAADMDKAEEEQDKRHVLWHCQRAIYGFDERETWGLDSCFYAWLYEHIKMYLEKADKIVNLEFHKFEYEGTTYTQKELLEQICEIIEYYFSDSFDDLEEADWNYVHNIEKMWAVVMPAMWW